MPTTTSERYTSLAATIAAAEADDEVGTIRGVAATYGVDIPRGPRLAERIAPGAFKAQVGAPNRVAVLWQHDWEEPIGRATGFKDSPSQLEFTARISAHDDIPTARKALALLREGVVDEISVGFEWGTWHEEGTDDGLTIVHTKARLREFSVVTFGALGRAARVQSVAAEGIAVEVYRRRLAGLTG